MDFLNRLVYLDQTTQTLKVLSDDNVQTSKILEEIEQLLSKPPPTIYTKFWFGYSGDNIIIVDKENANEE